jgi:hypothetical protein
MPNQTIVTAVAVLYCIWGAEQPLYPKCLRMHGLGLLYGCILSVTPRTARNEDQAAFGLLEW